MNATSILERQSRMIQFVGQAQRYLKERDMWEYATEDQITHLAESFRHDAFMKAAAPYFRQREAVVLSWLRLQPNPGLGIGDIPAPIRETMGMIDEMIASVAKAFGYAPQADGGAVE